MMKKILVSGKNKEITDAVIRLLQNYPDIHAVEVNTLEEIKDKLIKTSFDLLMLCGGFTKEEESILYEMREKLFPNLKILEHFGGGSGLLLSELKQTLNI